MPAPHTLLVDNGSLEPAATLGLRELAAQLSARTGHPVAPVSLLHSSGIGPTHLGGQPAEILFPSLERRLAAGENDFLILPLFFGPSRALTDYIPENVARLRAKHPELQLRVAAPLYQPHDDRLARIFVEQIVVEMMEFSSDRIVVVDHGSPVAAVTAVRDELAREVGRLLGSHVVVAPASMERRPGPEYDFCNPLLADLLASPPWNTGPVVVAMQFLLPGRHAGPDGDVAEICRAAEAANPELKTRMTKLIAEHPLLVEILVDRWRAAE
jgi:sirohydrochlorin ferrochelatase